MANQSSFLHLILIHIIQAYITKKDTNTLKFIIYQFEFKILKRL